MREALIPLLSPSLSLSLLSSTKWVLGYWADSFGEKFEFPQASHCQSQLEKSCDRPSRGSLRPFLSSCWNTASWIRVSSYLSEKDDLAVYLERDQIATKNEYGSSLNFLGKGCCATDGDLNHPGTKYKKWIRFDCCGQDDDCSSQCYSAWGRLRSYVMKHYWFEFCYPCFRP